MSPMDWIVFDLWNTCVFFEYSKKSNSALCIVFLVHFCGFFVNLWSVENNLVVSGASESQTIVRFRKPHILQTNFSLGIHLKVEGHWQFTCTYWHCKSLIQFCRKVGHENVTSIFSNASKFVSFLLKKSNLSEERTESRSWYCEE